MGHRRVRLPKQVHESASSFAWPASSRGAGILPGTTLALGTVVFIRDLSFLCLIAAVQRLTRIRISMTHTLTEFVLSRLTF